MQETERCQHCLLYVCLKKVELTGFRYASEQFKGFQLSDATFLNGNAGGVEVVPVVSAVSDGDIGRDPAFIVWLSTITGVLGILLVLNVAYAVRRLRKSTRLKTVSFHQTSSVIFLTMFCHKMKCICRFQ